MSSDLLQYAKIAGKGGAQIFFSNLSSTLIQAVAAIAINLHESSTRDKLGQNKTPLLFQRFQSLHDKIVRFLQP